MIDALQKSRRTGEFWNTIKKIQNHKCDKQNVVEMDQFIQFYKAKFSKSKVESNETILEASSVVQKNSLKGFLEGRVSEAQVRKYIQSLRKKCSAGIDANTYNMVLIQV